MKIRPVILCGGAGTRLWPNSQKHQAKQFIDFGNWTLLGKTLARIKASIFDAPIISTNSKYLKQVKQHLRKAEISKYKIILEPAKRNTAAAILSSVLIKDISMNQPIVFFSADHLIKKNEMLNKIIDKNKSNLTDQNIFIFGIKPKYPSTKYGYFIVKKLNKNVNKVIKFIEKPPKSEAKKIIKQKGYWNSGIFFIRKDSIINTFKKYQKNIYQNCLKSINNAKYKSNTYILDKNYFIKIPSKSFDIAILEKSRSVNAINLDLPWSDFGSWKEILKFFNKNRSYYYDKNKIFCRPWGKFINLFKGKNFLIKELIINKYSSLSLQKHNHRIENWLVTKGEPTIKIGNKIFNAKKNDYFFVPLKAKHTIKNEKKNSVKIVEAQVGEILKENDIIRYSDMYGRV